RELTATGLISRVISQALFFRMWIRTVAPSTHVCAVTTRKLVLTARSKTNTSVSRAIGADCTGLPVRTNVLSARTQSLYSLRLKRVPWRARLGRSAREAEPYSSPLVAVRVG